MATGLYLSWFIANTAFTIFVALSFSNVEHYAFIAGGLQAAASVVLWIGALWSNIGSIAEAMCIVGFVFQALVYALRFIVRS